MVWLRLEVSDRLIPIPISLDLMTVLVQAATAKAMRDVFGVIILKSLGCGL